MKNWDFDQIISHATKMQEKIKSLEVENEKLKTPFEAMKQPHNISFSHYSTDVGTYGYSDKIKARYEESLVLATENDSINAHNKDVVSKLRKTIIATGFPETKGEYKRSKMVHIPKEWTKDIVAEQGIGSAEIERRYQEFLKAVEQYSLKKKKDEELKERENLAIIEAKKKEIVFVDLCRDLKMDPLITSTDDIRESLLSQCKYLNLAVAGQAVRNDWSDGPWRVSNALSEFKYSPEDSLQSIGLDKDIFEEYQRILDNFEDGRSFRDCQYNYDYLFDLVDPDLMGLYNKLGACS